MRCTLQRLEEMKAEVEQGQREIERLQTRIRRSHVAIGGRLDRKIAALRAKQLNLLDRLGAVQAGADPERLTDLENRLQRVWGFIKKKAGSARGEFEQGYR